MLRSLLWRRAGREGRAGRFHLGLKTQIAALGLGGVALIGVIYFIGLRFQGEAQRTADSSARLESVMANVTEGSCRSATRNSSCGTRRFLRGLPNIWTPSKG